MVILAACLAAKRDPLSREPHILPAEPDLQQQIVAVLIGQGFTVGEPIHLRLKVPDIPSPGLVVPVAGDEAEWAAGAFVEVSH